MNTYYTLENGTRLEIFMWEEFFKNDTWREYAEVTPLDGKIYGGNRGKECKKKLFKDDNGIYIIWEDQKVYLNNFDYDTVDVMVNRIAECVEKNDRWLVSDCEIFATFMKDTDNVGIIIDMPTYDMVFPSLSFGIVGNNEYSVLCVPTEKQYAKNRWAYKFTVECENEELRKYIPSRNFYSSDFCSLLKSGNIKIVNKDKFKEEMKKMLQEKTEKENQTSYKVKKFFGLAKDIPMPVQIF